MGKGSKPWLNYYKPGAPVREFKKKPKHPRQLVWARLAMLFSAHRFYLWQPWKGVLFILAVFISAMLGVMISESFHSSTSWWSAPLAMTPWISLYVVEYIRLPGLVRRANRRAFGPRSDNVPELRGKIGPYAALKPITLFILILYVAGLIMGGSSIGNCVFALISLGLVIGIAIFVIQIRGITKSIELERQND